MTPVADAWWIDPILDFVNGEEWPAVDIGFLDGAADSVLLPTSDIFWIDTEFKVDDQDRQSLEAILDDVVKRGRASRPLCEKLAEQMGRIELSGGLSFDPKDGLTAALMVHPSSVTQLGAFAIAALVDAGFEDRIHRCALESCGRFFVAWKRTDQRYCCPGHGSQVRVKRSRERWKS